jgi:hypothetical protein
LKMITGGILVCSTIATCLVNQVPDIGLRITLFTLLGLCFGIPWVMHNMSGLVGGLICGLVVGIVATVPMTVLTGTTAPETVLKLTLTWAFPILAYTAIGSLPLLTGGS